MWIGWLDRLEDLFGRVLAPAAASKPCRSIAHKAERVTCRIREDTPDPVPVPGIQESPAKLENVFLRLVEVLDAQIQVKLLGLSRVRPPGRPVV
jgi:hypothetical protein